MNNAILAKYQRLNDDGRFFVDCALNAAMNNPEYINNISEEEKIEIKRNREEADRKRQIKDEEHNKFFENLTSEIEDYTEQDYISKLNELFSKMPWYKLRYFYIFINGKLHYDTKGGVVNG